MHQNNFSSVFRERDDGSKEKVLEQRPLAAPNQILITFRAHLRTKSLKSTVTVCSLVCLNNIQSSNVVMRSCGKYVLMLYACAHVVSMCSRSMHVLMWYVCSYVVYTFVMCAYVFIWYVRLCSCGRYVPLSSNAV